MEIKVMKTNKSYTDTEIAKHEFDLLLPLKSSRIEVNPATADDAKKACELSRDNIPNSVENISLIKNVISRNADNIFIFRKNQMIIGVYAMLMLTPLGLERLLLGEFDSKNPDMMCLTITGETPAAIYVWSYVAPGLAADGIRHVSKFLQQPNYRNINFFARPVTKAGLRITQNLGYEPLKNATEGLYRYVRLVNREPELQHAA